MPLFTDCALVGPEAGKWAINAFYSVKCKGDSGIFGIESLLDKALLRRLGFSFTLVVSLLFHNKGMNWCLKVFKR